LILLVFYARKVYSYKAHNRKSSFVSNCFSTYLLEIVTFDTILCIDLLVFTIFHRTDGRAHFMMKFFVNVFYVSIAVSSWLTFLFTLNRFLLLFHIRCDRFCLNTKYQSLFVFCTCVITNVLLLEMIYDVDDYSTINLINYNFPNHYDKTPIFLSTMIYYIIFSILPIAGSLVITVWTIRKWLVMRQKLLVSDQFFLFNTILKQMAKKKAQNWVTCELDGKLVNYIEFLSTCMPCITFSCFFIFSHLPFTCLELFMQSTRAAQFNSHKTATFVLNVLRYLFHGSKFYLLFFFSFKFRKEILDFLNCSKKKRVRRIDGNPGPAAELVRQNCDY
jgi:hypothetical protein